MTASRERAEISRLLKKLSDEELEELALIHFPEMMNKLGSGMSRLQKINRFMEHCHRRPEEFSRLKKILESWPTPLSRDYAIPASLSQKRPGISKSTLPPKSEREAPATESSSNPPPREGELESMAELPVGPSIFGTFLVLGFLVVTIFLFPFPEWIFQLGIFVCRPEPVLRLGSAVIVWSLILLSWRIIGEEPNPNGEITVSVPGIEGKLPHPEKLHPWFISDWALYWIGGLLIGLAVLLCFTRLSPFYVTEAPPTVESFEVQHHDSPILPSRTITLTQGSTLRIVANFPPDALARCEWHAQRGTLTSVSDCTTSYHAPSPGTDTIWVSAQARCSALGHEVSILNIVVVDSN